MTKRNYEVWTDSGDGIYLVIKDGETVLAIFENWEYGQFGCLRATIEQLANEPDRWEVWDGDLFERLSEESSSSYYHASRDDAMPELYSDICNGDLEAWVEEDSDTIIYRDGWEGGFGCGIREALGIVDDDEAE